MSRSRMNAGLGSLLLSAPGRISGPAEVGAVGIVRTVGAVRIYGVRSGFRLFPPSAGAVRVSDFRLRAEARRTEIVEMQQRQANCAHA